jgi:hypothetical protein
MSDGNQTAQNPGKQAYDDYWERKFADPEFRAVYEAEAAKKELWLQLVEARQAAGLTQAELARIEKRGYDAYTLTTLCRYVAALGEGFTLSVEIHRARPDEAAA